MTLVRPAPLRSTRTTPPKLREWDWILVLSATSLAILGSALIFITMTFVSMAFAGALLGSVREGEPQFDDNTVAFGRAVMLEISHVYALRMAGVFMISLGTIWLRTGLMPRWMAGLTYALAGVLLFVVNLSLWVGMLFPAWVLVVSVGIMVRTRGQGPAGAASGEKGPAEPDG